MGTAGACRAGWGFFREGACPAAVPPWPRGTRGPMDEGHVCPPADRAIDTPTTTPRLVRAGWLWLTRGAGGKDDDTHRPGQVGRALAWLGWPWAGRADGPRARLPARFGFLPSARGGGACSRVAVTARFAVWCDGCCASAENGHFYAWRVMACVAADGDCCYRTLSTEM